MKKLLYLVLTAFLLFTAGCASGGSSAAETAAVNEVVENTDAPAAEVDDVSSATPLGEGWKIDLMGVRNDELWESQLSLWEEAEDGITVEMSLEKKGETNLYSGILLKDIVAMVDDPSGGMPYEFQEDLWKEGYDITLTAADGYSSSFNTADASSEEVLLVNSIDGKAVSPRIAGNLTGKAWVRDLVSIELSLAPVDLTQNSFEFVLEINDKISSYTIADLEAMDIYVEDKGGFTNSYGNSTEGIYGGVKLIPLLSKSMNVSADSAIKIIAMDGYEMSYGGDMLLDQKDGDWILAFKENGEYMPEDPGYIRLVKVGPQNPNITGHVSARMIKKIVTEGEPFKDFGLTIVQKDLTEVFDRQTMQSGVSVNKDKVTYYYRKKDQDIEYTGISLWKLLERPTGYKAVEIAAADGFSVTLDNAQIEGNDDVIIAMYTGEEDNLLDDSEWPLRLVWDKDAALVPDGIKAVRNVEKITLIY